LWYQNKQKNNKNNCRKQMKNIFKHQFRSLSIAKKNPFYEEMKSNVNDWIDKFKLLDLSNPLVVSKVNANDLWSVTAYCWPLASREKINLIGKINFWLWLYDDWFESVPLEKFKEKNKKIFEIMDGKEFKEKNDPFLDSFFDFFNCFEKIAGEYYKKKFVENFKFTLSAAEEEIEISKNRGYFKSIEEYMRIRLESSACCVCAVFTEWSKDIELTNLSESEIAKANEMMNIFSEQTCLINDFFSYSKEKAAKNNTNLALVYEDIYKYSSQKALKITLEETEKRTDDLEKLYLTIDGKNQKLLKEYADGLIDSLSGHNKWIQTITKKYSEQISLINEKEENYEKLVIFEEEFNK